MTLRTQAIQTLEQVRAFVAGTAPVSFTLTDRNDARAWMTDTLKRFVYARASRADRGVLRRYVATVTGLSRAQVTRRITQFSAPRADQTPAWHARRAVCPALYGGRHSSAGRGRCTAWQPVRQHHAQVVRTRMARAWRCPLRASGDDFQRSSVQLACSLRLSGGTRLVR